VGNRLGESIWHRFAHTPGRIHAGDTADITCDHYRRWPEDIATMRRLGLGAYRFSIAWARLFPTGAGTVNAAGFDFYDRLVDGLAEAGIRPLVTLYHWDLPQALEDRGGWLDADIANRFADYTEAVVRRLGDRVGDWITFNEPWVFTWLGYGLGVHAPGRNDIPEALRAGHHVLIANGLAVERIRSVAPSARVGLTLSLQAHIPATDHGDDVAAARRSAAFHNDWFLEPVMTGEYPVALREEFADALPQIDDSCRAVIRTHLDFLGVNYYTRHVVAHAEGGFLRLRPVRPVGRYTDMDWEIYPAGLYLVLKELSSRWRLPLIVTENGAGFENEEPGSDGVIDDHERQRYLQSHLEMVHRAISEGADVRGYMVWSLMDNFEWAFGFAKRFGLVHCDFATGRRTDKGSASWYAAVVARNGI
jgi:beta-glucosidase